MQLRLPITIILLLTGCTTLKMISQVQPAPYIDSSLRVYLSRFTSEAEYRGVVVNTMHLTMQFDLDRGEPEDVVGTCDVYEAVPTIKVDRAAWNEMPEGNREELVFHELGHCLLKRGHCDVLADGKRLSIMSSRIEDAGEYNKRREEYVDELFEPDTRCGLNNKISNDRHTSLHGAEAEKP